MSGYLRRFYFTMAALVILTFAALRSNAQVPTTVQEINTDVIAHRAIRLLNAHQVDSVYALAGEAFKQQITPAQWKAINDAQLTSLLPFNNMIFKGSTGLVNQYKLEGKVTLTFNISLDSLNKIVDFSFVPYREDIKPVAMTEDEKKTDVVAMKVLTFLSAKQTDSAYVFAGDGFRSKIDLPTWHNITEKQLYPLLPFARPVFVGSKDGISKYKLDQLQFLIGLDQTGKFETLFIQAYHEDAQKSKKAATDNPLHSKLDNVVNKWLSGYIQTKGNVGLSAAVYYKGHNHYYNYGETANGNHKLPNLHTLYEIGSITKTFTATLLAKAVTDGLVTLNTPITQFLPDSVLNPALKLMTLKQLSNHTSGLPRMPTNIDATVTDLAQPYENYDEAHLFSFLKNFKSARGAGISYEYSNLAAGLLGVILEKIYHKPYEELVKQYITQPLLLNETTITLSPTDLKHLAQGYDLSNNPAPVWKQNSTKAAGAIKSSAFDMLQYGKKQFQLLNNPLAKALQLTHQTTFDDGTNKVGLGWHYLYDDKDPVLQHTGGTGGYRTAICINLKRDMVLVVLTNNATTGDSLGLQLMEALEKALPK
jgi:CubicO group peptidase (beta-lactamase class C family)